MGQREALLAATLIHLLMAYVRPRRLGVVAAPDMIVRVAEEQTRLPDVCYTAWESLPSDSAHLTPVADYAPDRGWDFLNLVSTVGAFVIALGVVALLGNLWVSARRREPAGDDPWGGFTLEWATSSPPPEHNFDKLPPIRSERPVYDARMAAAAKAGSRAR